MSESEGPRSAVDPRAEGVEVAEADSGTLWTPAAEIAVEVSAAIAAAGEVEQDFTPEGDGGDPEDGSDGSDGSGADQFERAVESVVEAVAEVRPEVAAVLSPVVAAVAPGAQVGSTSDSPSVPSAPAAPTASTAPSADQTSRHIARAEALAELGRRQQALDVLNELIVAGAEDVRIWRGLASIYLETGDGEKALRAADWVVTFEPQDEWGHRLRASALRLLQRPEEAVDAASEAVRLDPDVWQGHAALAMALHSTGDLSAAAAAARQATALAAEQDPEVATELQQVEAVVQQPASTAEATTLETLEADLGSALNGRPGLDEESLSHVSSLVLRGLEFSAGAGWLVSFGGVAIPGFNIRFLIPLAVLLILGVFLFGPARKAGRDIWRYLVEYLWQDTKTRTALLMALAAHVWMIAGSSVGHIQGGSALGIGLLTHLAGRTVLAKKAPELNPLARPAPSRG